MVKSLTERQKNTLKKHSKHHSAKHMTMMRKEMRAGKSFSAAHKKAKKRGGPLVQKALEGFAKLGDALGLLQADPIDFQEEVKSKRLHAMGLDADTIEEQLQAREEARKLKNWSESDRIRDTLAEQGVVVMDTPSGVSWKLIL